MSNVGTQGASGEYVLGVVEGFYGLPWCPTEREDLFQRMKIQNMNTYLYAPKHDDKHRHNWREKYTDDELGNLKKLIDISRSYGVEFIFSVSPGLDLVFSSNSDLQQLLDKFCEIQKLGCKSFAILFDDINAKLCDADSPNFESPAHAQSTVANFLLDNLGPLKYFMFCPTEYCASFARPSVEDSTYLKNLGNLLHAEIMIMWTGPRVVSRTISYQSIKQITRIFQRQPIIWDNYHANDYDRRRIYLGPYSGRHSDIVGITKGVLTNPNCQFESNFVAIHTLSAWRAAFKEKTTDSEPIEVQINPIASDDQLTTDEDEEHSGHGEYCPKRCLVNALSDWLPLFNTNLTSQRLDLEDLMLLVDFYYLPYEYGKEAIRCIRLMNYCIKNYTDRMNQAWKSNVEDIIGLAARIDRLTDRMSRSASCKTPAVTLSPFLIELSNVFVIVVAFIQWINQFGEHISSLNHDSNKNASEINYNYLDAEAQPEVTITSRLLAILPKCQVYSFILNDITTPWFPGLTMKFTKPTKTRHGIFSDSDEMEFDDSDTWPLSELIRLDNVNIDDRNILFAINATIHPLEHATALIITNDVEGWKKGALIHLAVRQKGAMASLHSVTIMMLIIINIIESMKLDHISVTLDSGTDNFRNLIRRLAFYETSDNQSSTRATFISKS